MKQMVELIDGDVPAPGTLKPVAKGVYWLQMPLPMRLDHINLYMIDEGDSWTLIDTGMKTPDTRSLWETVIKRYCQNKPLKQVVVTHMHPDHVGLAGWLVARFNARFYMTMTEYFVAKAYLADQQATEANVAFYRACGMPQAYLDYVRETPFSLSDLVERLPDTFIRLQNNREVRFGEYTFRVITGEGHTPEHASLYCEEAALLIAGDQLLPSITSNVGVASVSPDADPLTDWLLSLDQLDLLNEDALVLPAHNKPFRGVRARVDEIRVHHDRQLNALQDALDTPKTCHQLLPVLFPRDLHSSEMSLAVGECLAHLNHLLEKQQIDRTQHQGVYYYERKHAS